MPRCDLVITHGGHGTLARALVSGVPGAWSARAGGDMAENAARVDWAGVGVRLAPRFCTPWGVRLAVRRALRAPALRARAAALARVGVRAPRARDRRGPAGALGRDAGRGYGAGGVGVGVGPGARDDPDLGAAGQAGRAALTGVGVGGDEHGAEVRRAGVARRPGTS